MADLLAIQGVMAVRYVADIVRVGGRRHRRLFLQRTSALQYFSDEEFLARYRLSKETFGALLAEIEHLPASRNRRGLRISLSLQVLVALRYLATGNFQLTLADTADMSQASVSRCITRVVRAIAGIAPRHIHFPTPAEEAAVMQAFSTIAGMPGCIGCVDGTLIPIRGPGGDDAELYQGRKGYCAYNVMAVCDASLSVTNLVVNWPGSAHESRVFKESQLCQTLQGGHYCGFLLGDSGYPCRPYLLTPYGNPRTPEEHRFNEAHSRTRCCVERLFGILKRRFCILSTPIRTKMASRSDIVIATVVLHNIAIKNNLPLEEGPDIRVERNMPDVDHQDNTAAGQARRAEIVERFFS